MNHTIWVFHGAQAGFSSGVFTTVTIAEEWIKKHRLTGMLTAYPLNEGVYDWAKKNDFLNLRKDHPIDAQLIQKFTTASQPHFYYEDGERV